MSFAESQAWESDDKGNEHVLVTYRVRVCTRCGHAACPCCNGTWCDTCLGTSGDGIVVNEACAEATECVYEETEAVVEVRREVKTETEYEAWFNEDLLDGLPDGAVVCEPGITISNKVVWAADGRPLRTDEDGPY